MTAKQLFRSRSERSWAEYMVGKPFTSLEVVARKGHLLPLDFTVVGYTGATDAWHPSTFRVHHHHTRDEASKRETVPARELIMKLCDHRIVETSEPPVEHGRA